MSDITDVSVVPLKNSKFLEPLAILYTRNKMRMQWDFMRCHDCVAVIIFNVTRNVLVCVKQFRPTFYLRNIPKKDQKNTINTRKYPSSLGMSVEFCAGLVDKQKPIEEIAKSEILEETGYNVPIEKLQKIKTIRSTGVAVYDVHMYYVEVEDTMKVNEGGGLRGEGEQISVIELSLAEAKNICYSDKSTPHFAFIFGLIWFFNCKLQYMLHKLNV